MSPPYSYDLYPLVTIYFYYVFKTQAKKISELFLKY